ncbi:MAG: hypothetical protein ACQEQU_03870 [Spirochaetota bacterium]
MDNAIIHHTEPIINLSEIPSIPQQAMEAALGSYILSSSGWRHIFDESGDPESTNKGISPVDIYLVAGMAMAFADVLEKLLDKPCSQLQLLLARDTRPTGPVISEILIQTLLARGVRISYPGVAPIPEVTASCSLSDEYDGFIYVSASHNPPGYNGIKFGRNGAVMGGAAAEELITRFKEIIRNPSADKTIRALWSIEVSDMLRDVLHSSPGMKEHTLEYYRMFTAAVASGDLYICQQDQIYNTIRDFASTNGIGILADFNGSARTLSIDEHLLRSMGVSFRGIHTQPGVFAHRIVPEGEGLEDCRQALELAFSEDPSFLLGYVPDCDGDRGNIVYINENNAKAYPLEAQQVFALTVLSELAFLSLKHPEETKLAVVVNGPTSMRIDTLAAYFGATVFRAEVGEANVVALAQQLRQKGYQVRILGEGSNGGNITHPAQVRDPINTILSLLKLLTLRSKHEQVGLFDQWCRLSGKPGLYTDHFSLQDILDSLPSYTTTSAYESRAMIHINTQDHEQLKRRYEDLFIKRWTQDNDFFRSLGISAWREFNTIETSEIEGTGASVRQQSSTGGLKIAFYNREGTMTDYIWMRGSKTEPVFRILADCRGKDPSREQQLLSLQRSLVEQADTI